MGSLFYLVRHIIERFEPGDETNAVFIKYIYIYIQISYLIHHYSSTHICFPYMVITQKYFTMQTNGENLYLESRKYFFRDTTNKLVYGIAETGIIIYLQQQ